MAIEPAHKRAPIEIWDAILRLAVISPLIPHSDDDVVDLHQLFARGPDSFRIHRRVECIRTGLRLVCRGWNSVLKDKGVGIGYTEAKSDGSHRWEAYTEFGFWDPSRAPPAFHQTETLTHEHSNLIIFMASNVNKHPIKAVETMGPQLRALQYPCVPVFQKVYAFPQNPWIQSLTHLELTSIGRNATTPVGEQVTLPRLRALSLKFVYSDTGHTAGIQGQFWITWWLLPSLQTLKIGGIVAAAFFHDMYQFFSRAWPNVTSLSLAPTCPLTEPQPFIIQPSLWLSFPNLRIFGTNFAVFGSSIAPPPLSYHRICLVLDTVWDSPQTPGISSLVAARQILDEWKISTIIFPFTWGEITSSVRDVYEHSTKLKSTPESIKGPRSTGANTNSRLHIPTLPSWAESSRATAALDPFNSMHDLMWPSWFIFAGLNANIQFIDVDRVPLSQEHRVELRELLRNWYQPAPSV